MKPCPNHHHHEPEMDDPSGEQHFHVFPEWEEHDLTEDCRCGPKKDWFLKFDGSWGYVVVHSVGH